MIARSLTTLAAIAALGCQFPTYEFVSDATLGDASPHDGLIFPVDDAGVEGCVANACGGCVMLAGAPESKCGTCGTYKCDGPDLVRCENPDKNACGGCAVLSAKPGDACSTGCGNVECNGVDAVKCSGATTANACGGCATLGHEPGTSCNVGTECPGLWTCDGTEKVSCTGGTSFNACGGCKTLTAAPDAACGTCGKYVCSTDKQSVSCKEASPAAGSYCSMRCPTSRYACNPTTRTTSCSTTGEATLVDTENASRQTDQNGLCNQYRKAVSFSVEHQGMITKVAVNMQRKSPTCECAPCGSTAGDVVVSVFTKRPDDSTATPLGSGRIAASAIVDGWNEFGISGGTVISDGAPVWLRVEYTGNLYHFALYSSSAAPTGQTYWIINSAGPKTVTQYMNFRVTMLACK